MTPEPPTTTDRMQLPLPGGHDKVLLHSCCAPCSGEVMEAMQASGIDFTIYFYNPNIHRCSYNYVSQLDLLDLFCKPDVIYSRKHYLAYSFVF